MLGSLRGLAIAAVFALPTAAAAQRQVSENMLTQGPAPSFGPADIVQSADAPDAQHGQVAGAVGPVVADPLDATPCLWGRQAAASGRLRTAERPGRRSRISRRHSRFPVSPSILPMPPAIP